MDSIQQIKRKASSLGKRILLPETDDSRVLKAAKLLSEKKLCRPVLMGDEETIRSKAKEDGIELNSSRMEFRSWPDEPRKDEMLEHLGERLKKKKLSDVELNSLAASPLYHAGLLMQFGEADGAVGGSIAATPEIIKAALYTVGVHPDSELVSSIFLMTLTSSQTVTYADCGVVPYPDPDQLASIAIDSAKTHMALTEQEPKIAFLSFSTKGSAKHERVELVQHAFQKAKKIRPDWIMDGELQFDAAYVPEINERKAPGSPLRQGANVFIFPNLDAGNIAYKITERLAGASATGPILQGLAKPYLDLSRGCSVEDIVNAASVSAVLAE